MEKQKLQTLGSGLLAACCAGFRFPLLVALLLRLLVSLLQDRCGSDRAAGSWSRCCVSWSRCFKIAAGPVRVGGCAAAASVSLAASRPLRVRSRDRVAGCAAAASVSLAASRPLRVRSRDRVAGCAAAASVSRGAALSSVSCFLCDSVSVCRCCFELCILFFLSVCPFLLSGVLAGWPKDMSTCKYIHLLRQKHPGIFEKLAAMKDRVVEHEVVKGAVPSEILECVFCGAAKHAHKWMCRRGGRGKEKVLLPQGSTCFTCAKSAEAVGPTRSPQLIEEAGARNLVLAVSAHKRRKLGADDKCSCSACKAACAC